MYKNKILRLDDVCRSEGDEWSLNMSNKIKYGNLISFNKQY